MKLLLSVADPCYNCIALQSYMVFVRCDTGCELVSMWLLFSCHRKHKKGQTEEVTRKRTRKTQKFQKAVAGATINEIMAKRNQKPEVRKAQREQAIR